ncbi:PilW family protein [Luteimonas fraxinea]|uniref:PilW family protein n=1 Tax=Luteimonas fraxinea TaxID=2901869 RepID=A0ABS8U9D6_9GAMM|nr:PilW family protein [Luteimonas fraxinea]MCD9096111.1 PilW family protein [Luteimonas fraxinea]MCD9124700.1 PilW family protein [Luteimonas fraxinea]UHH10720.1 PilW family protein [Luteimonas fraxinea]
MNRSAARVREAGVSLIELMVALLIGSLLLLGVLQIFEASRVSYQLSTGLARNQENARFAMDFLQRELRMAGHLGCVNDQSRFLPENTSGTRLALASTFTTTPAGYTTASFPLRFDMGIQGFEFVGSAGGNQVTLPATPVVASGAAAWLPQVDAGLYGNLSNPVAGSDIVVLRYFSPMGAQMQSFNPAATPMTISVDATQVPRLTEGLANPGLFGISDCMNAAVFQATSRTNGLLTVGVGGLNAIALTGNESFVIGQARVYRAEVVVFYVGINASQNPSLYRLRYSAVPGGALVVENEELVEGVESLQLRYGQDSATSATVRPTGNIGSGLVASALLPTADPVTAWRRVGSVEIGLVVRSTERAAAPMREAGAAELSALGVRFATPDDGRYRAVYEDTIALRNRLFGN